MMMMMIMMIMIIIVVITLMLKKILIPVGPKAPIIKKTSNTITHLDPKRQPIRINIGDSLTTFKGTSVSINCPSTGFPDPRIQWNHNDISLTPQIALVLNYTLLVLTNPEDTDSGKYTCVASNPGGSQNASSSVTFLGKYTSGGSRIL